MCSVNFNNQFGMNVKQYQQMQQMKFGTGVRTASFNPQLSFDSGVFTAGKPNLFASGNSHSLNFNGVQYDNKYQMLNNVPANDDKNGNDTSFKSNLKSLFKEIGSGISSLGKDIKSLATKGFKAIASLFKKGDGAKSGNVDKALGDIKNAQDKETLQGAVNSAVQEQGQIQKQEKQSEQALKGLEGKASQADQAEEKAGAKVDQSNEQLSSNESKLEQAKADYQTALDGVNDAQYAVADAENNLAAAKSAATKDNPNTAAIQQAEAQVQSAKKAEIAAREKLQQAEQAQTQAQQAVDASKQQVDAATTEHTQAQQNADAVKQQVDTAEAQQKEIQSSNQEITGGVEEGNKKLEQMDNQQLQPGLEADVKGTDPNQPAVMQKVEPGVSADVKGTDPTQPAVPGQENKFETQDKLLEGKGYNDEQKAEVLKARQDIQNMQPGDTIKCGADTYTMDKDGTIRVNDTAGEYTNKDDAAMNAGDSAMRTIDSKKRSDAEMALLRGQNGSKVKTSSNKKPQGSSQADKPAEAPKPEAKPVEEKKVETPAPEAPKAEDKKADAPKTETKPVEEKKVETPKEEAKPVEDKKADAPKDDNNKTDTSKNDNVLVEKNGRYLINGTYVKKEQFEIAKGMDKEILAAGFAPTSNCRIDTDDEGNSRSFAIRNGKYMVDGQEVDSKKFLSEYNDTMKNAKEHNYSSERIDVYSSCANNPDGTYTLPNGMGGTQVIDNNGRVQKMTMPNGGINSGTVTYDYKNRTKETDIGSMKDITQSSGFGIISKMSNPNSAGEILDKDGNVFMTMKDGKFFNAKGKEIKSDKAMDLINDNKTEGLKLVEQLKKKKV